PDGLAAGPLPCPRLAQPRRRPNAPRVRRRRGGSGPARAAARRRRVARVVAAPTRPRRRDVEERRNRRAVPAADRGYGSAPRGRGPPGVASPARGLEPGAQRRVGEPPAGRRSGRPPGRCHRRAERERRARRSAVRRPIGRRGTPGHAGGDPDRAGRASPAPSLGGPTGARADRAAGGIATGRGATRLAGGGPSGMIRAMRPVIIAANWKMNTTPADAGELAREIARRTRVDGVTRVICPPFLCLAAVRDALAEADPDVAIGAQNVHHELAGAYTGEISAPMLDGLATWVILGHSERRRDAGETDQLIGAKLARAVEAGLRPILCVGEQLADREAGRAIAVAEAQL